MIARCTAVFCLLLSLPTNGRAAATWTAAQENSSGVQMKITPWLNAVPPTGFMPFRISVENSAGGAGSWSVSSTFNDYRVGQISTSVTLSAPTSATAGLTAYFPSSLGSPNLGNAYNRINVNAHGTGIHSGFVNGLNSCESTSSTENLFIGISQDAASYWTWLKTDIEESQSRSSGKGTPGSMLDATATPSDWLGLTGLTSYWLTEADYTRLSGIQKTAIQDWVMLGGHLLLTTERNNQMDGLYQSLGGKGPANPDAPLFRGLGDISLVSRETPGTEAEARRKFVGGLAARTLPAVLTSQFSDSETIRALAGPLTRASWLIFIFILLFGIIIGPFNLFWLAPAGRRHKLFWTTPLIALVGSGLLLAVIFFHDGTGGTGARLTLGLMHSGQNRLTVIQEQSSRTGVLFGSEFTTAEPVMMHQVLRDRSWSGSSGEREFRIEGSRFSGDWFQSRSVQTQLVQTVRPTRGALHVRPGTDAQPPSIISTFDTRIQRVFVLDEQGRKWTAQDLSPGERKTLLPAKDDLNLTAKNWGTDSLPVLASTRIRTALDRYTSSKRAFALAEVADSDASKLAIPTLDSIRWTTSKAMLIGDYEADTQP